MKPNVNIEGRIQLKHDTKEHWESVQAIFTPRAGELIIYDDYKIDKSGKNIPGIKIGNGVSFLKDLLFIDSANEITEEEANKIMDDIDNGID